MCPRRRSKLVEEISNQPVQAIWNTKDNVSQLRAGMPLPTARFPAWWSSQGIKWTLWLPAWRVLIPCYQLITPMAVKVDGIHSWTHHTHPEAALEEEDPLKTPWLMDYSERLSKAKTGQILILFCWAKSWFFSVGFSSPCLAPTIISLRLMSKKYWTFKQVPSQPGCLVFLMSHLALSQISAHYELDYETMGPVPVPHYPGLRS